MLRNGMLDGDECGLIIQCIACRNWHVWGVLVSLVHVIDLERNL